MDRVHALFEDHINDYNVKNINVAGPHIIKDEIRAAIRKLKSGKTSSSYIIWVRRLETMKLTRWQHYSTKSMAGQISPNIFKSISL